MNKTLSIGLAGYSFMIEEHAYIKLSDYLAALRSSLDVEEADEVMHDIEIRMVELFKESLGKREVINDSDVEKVIKQIGRPEIIEEQEEVYFSEEPKHKHKHRKHHGSHVQKQLFRNPEKAKIGGVCAGLASYFGMDVTVMRLIWVATFIIMIPLPGSPMLIVLLYVILWIVLPEAETATDYLKMKGKPITFDNLKHESNKIVQFANESTQKVGELYNQNKPLINNTGTGIWNVIRYILGAFLALMGLSLLFGSFAVLGTGWMDSSHIHLPGNIQFILEEDYLQYFVVCFAFLSVFIPALVCLFLSVKLLSPKTKFNHTGYVFAALCLVWIILGILIGFRALSLKNQYSGNNEEVENIAINTKSDSILIDLNKVSIPANFRAYGDDFYSDQKTIFEEEYPTINVTRKEGNFAPYLIIKKDADGYNQPLKMHVPVQILDNKVFIPNYVSYPYEYRMRDYGVDYELVVPKNKKVIALNGEHGFSIYDGGKSDDHDNDDKDSATLKINNNTIIVPSGNSDTIIVNGKKVGKAEADLMLKTSVDNVLKDLERNKAEVKKMQNEADKTIKKINIQIDDAEKEISIKTNK